MRWWRRVFLKNEKARRDYTFAIPGEVLAPATGIQTQMPQ